MGDVRQELLPCPFCGGKASVRIPGDSDGFPIHVACRCGAQLFGKRHHFSGQSEAVIAWNRRALSARTAVPEGWRDFLDWCAANVIVSSGRAVFNDQEGFRRRLHAMISSAPQPAGEDAQPEVWINRCPVNHDRRATCPRCESSRPPGAKHGQPVSAPPEPAPSAPAEMMRDAYVGAREDLLDWKRRAQRAEAELRRLGYAGIDASEPPSAPDPIKSSYSRISNNCVDSSAPADVEALATSVGVYTPADPSCGSDRSWTFSAEGLHDFARCLSGAQQAGDGKGGGT